MNDFLDKMRFWIPAHAPAWAVKASFAVWIAYKNLTMPQQKKSFGPLNQDKTFYVIRLYPPASGFLADYNYVLGYMKNAYDHGWIPVVDMQNYQTLYNEDSPIHGTTNVWEYFFEQPLDPATGKRYTLEEVYQSKNVILSNGSDQFCNYTGDADPEVLKWQHEMYLRVPFKKELTDYIEKMRASIQIPADMDLIGAPIRGSDLGKRFYGHAIQTTTEETIELLKTRVEAWSHEDRKVGIFVNSEEQTAIDLVRERFTHVYCTNSVRFVNNESDKVNRVADLYNKISKYENILQYLTNIYLLSQCDSLFGTMNNGYYTAIIWNGGKFSHLETIDKGTYN